MIIQHPAIWAFHFQFVTLSCFIWSRNRWKSWIIDCYVFTNETAQNQRSIHMNLILRCRNPWWFQIFFLVIIYNEGSKWIKLLITAATIFIAWRHSHNAICRPTAFLYTILFMTAILKKNACIDIGTIISWIKHVFILLEKITPSKIELISCAIRWLDRLLHQRCLTGCHTIYLLWWGHRSAKWRRNLCISRNNRDVVWGSIR